MVFPYNEVGWYLSRACQWCWLPECCTGILATISIDSMAWHGTRPGHSRQVYLVPGSEKLRGQAESSECHTPHRTVRTDLAKLSRTGENRTGRENWDSILTSLLATTCSTGTTCYLYCMRVLRQTYLSIYLDLYCMYLYRLSHDSGGGRVASTRVVVLKLWSQWAVSYMYKIISYKSCLFNSKVTNY